MFDSSEDLGIVEGCNGCIVLESALETALAEYRVLEKKCESLTTKIAELEADCESLFFRNLKLEKKYETVFWENSELREKLGIKERQLGERVNDLHGPKDDRIPANTGKADESHLRSYEVWDSLANQIKDRIRKGLG